MSMPTRQDIPVHVRGYAPRHVGTLEFPVGAPASPPPRRGPFGLVRRHPLMAFFVLAYAASWLAWLPYVLSADGLGVLDFRFPALLGDSQIPGVLPGAYIGPLGSALVVTAITGGRAGLRDWRRRLLRLRVRWYWYVIVLTGVPALLVGGALLLPGAAATLKAPSAIVLAAFLPLLLLQVVTTGLAEEPGWRDFALPLLQRRHGPVLGTLFLGVVWSLWHLPLFFTHWSLGGTRPDTVHWWTTLGAFLFMSVAISYLITWVFNHTRESLPAALVLHATNNTVASIVLPELFPHAEGSWMLTGGAIGYGAAALVLLVVTRGRLGYRGPRD
ncbi:CPBP family intramembrane glutamic endopeptidase [Actinomadura napierensis]|uniref:Type II CAAX endopeptidase family protein n=1 Tax=Actinomadura napierensis TaxID=267854 RepID=A0ABP5M3B7_9ACTN